MNRYELLKQIYINARLNKSMNHEESIPEEMNNFDIEYLIALGLIGYNEENKKISITIKGILLVESSQINVFGRVDVANALGYLEYPNGDYTVSSQNKKYH